DLAGYIRIRVIVPIVLRGCDPEAGEDELRLDVDRLLRDAGFHNIVLTVSRLLLPGEGFEFWTGRHSDQRNALPKVDQRIGAPQPRGGEARPDVFLREAAATSTRATPLEERMREKTK